MKENEKYNSDDEDSKKDDFQDLKNSKIGVNIENDIKNDINNDIKNDNKNDNIDDNKDSIKKENIIFDEIEKNEKIENIVCPNCGITPNLEIDYKNFIVKSNCPKCENNDIKNYKLVYYIKESNEKIPESIKCDGCNKTNVDLGVDKNKMFICTCGKQFCEECKEKHEEIDDSNDSNDNKNNHDLINYSEKDYRCNCIGKFSDYDSFCVTCKKNFCGNCQIEHKENNPGHTIIFFSKEIDADLSEDIIKKRRKILKRRVTRLMNF